MPPADAAAPRARPRSSLLRRVLLLMLAVLAPFLLIELGLRAFHDARVVERQELSAAKPHCSRVLSSIFRRDPDEAVRYVLAPSAEVEDEGAVYTTNALGLRGPEITSTKAPGVRRILVLGDSYAFGLGVPQDGTITAALQRLLADQPGPPVEVINFGVPGYHTGQELARLRREGFALQPDVVVLFYCANDEAEEAFHYDPEIGVLYGDVLPLPYSWKGWLRRSALYGLIANSVARARLESGELKAMEPHQWPPTRQRLEEMFAACKEHGVPLVVLNLPHLINTATLQDPQWQYRKNYDRIGALADAHDVPWIDLRQVLADAVEYVELLFVRLTPTLDPHLNARGYEIVAGALATRLRELGLLH